MSTATFGKDRSDQIQGNRQYLANTHSAAPRSMKKCGSAQDGRSAVQSHITRVIIVEDENLFRDLLKTTLSDMSFLSIVGTYASGQKSYDDFPHAKPDVAVMDIDLGAGWTGVETGLNLRKLNPDLGIVLLSNHASPDVLSTIPENEISGWSYLLKRSVHNLQTLVRAIEGSRDHLVVLDPHLLEITIKKKKSPVRQLSPRQVEILTLVSQGYTNGAIAKTMFLSEKSIENQLTGIYSALHINSANPKEHARVRAVLAFLGKT